MLSLLSVKIYNDDDDDDDWTAPDGSHREELASLVLGLQEGAWADEPIVTSEDLLPQIFFLTSLLVSCIFTLDIVVALEPLLQADLQSSPFSVSCSAHQLLLPTASFFLLGSRLDLTAPVQAFISSIPHALSRCFSSTSGGAPIVALLVLPIRLIGADLWVDCLPGGSFASKLVAGVGGVWIAPEIQRKALFRIPSCEP